MSTLKADTIQNTSGGAATLTKQHAPKTWMSFNGTVSSNYVLDSFNVASTVDSSTGNYDMNISSSMTDSNWCVACGENDDPAAIDRNLRQAHMRVSSSSALDIQSGATNTTSADDLGRIYVVCMGDLA